MLATVHLNDEAALSADEVANDPPSGTRRNETPSLPFTSACQSSASGAEGKRACPPRERRAAQRERRDGRERTEETSRARQSGRAQPATRKRCAWPPPYSGAKLLGRHSGCAPA